MLGGPPDQNQQGVKDANHCEVSQRQCSQGGSSFHLGHREGHHYLALLAVTVPALSNIFFLHITPDSKFRNRKQPERNGKHLRLNENKLQRVTGQL